MENRERGQFELKINGGLRMTRTSDLYFIRIVNPNLTSQINLIGLSMVGCKG